MMEMRIGDAFHALRMEEIELTADYLMKKQEEREAAREERERLREERKVELELAAERERLEKERRHLVTVIEKLQASGSGDPDSSASSQMSTMQLHRTTTGLPTFERVTSM